MNLKNFATGVGILQKHYKDPEGYPLCAEHDQIWLESTDTVLSPTDVEQMIAAGWFQENVSTVGADFAVCDYDADEGWTAYI